MIKLCFFFEKVDITLFLRSTHRTRFHDKYINFSLYEDKRIAITGCTVMKLDSEANVK